MTQVWQDPWGPLTAADGAGYYEYHDRNCPCGVLRVAQSDQHYIPFPARPPAQPGVLPMFLHFPGLMPPIPNLVPWAIAQLLPIPAPMTDQWLAWLMQLIADELLKRGLLPQPTNSKTLDHMYRVIMDEVVSRLPDASKPNGKMQTSIRTMIVDYTLSHIPVQVAPQAPIQGTPQVMDIKRIIKAKKRRWAAAQGPVLIDIMQFITGFHKVGPEWVPNNGVAPANIGDLDARIWAQPGVHSPAWETGSFVLLIDDTLAHWNGFGWMLSGRSAVA